MSKHDKMISEFSLCVILCGGIAVLKTLEALRILIKMGIRVEVVMTESATQFVTPLTVGTLTQTPPHIEMFDSEKESTMRHIDLSRRHDAILVAPATANIIAKMAHGLADDLASTILLASTAPIIIAPAMNHRMWSHPATQRNLQCIERDGVTVISPEEGEMACQEYGMGRLVEAEILAQQVKQFLFNSSLDLPSHKKEILNNKHILITAGPTVEPIDPIRAITNHSSGKQGYAIAKAAQELGAKVTLVSGPTSLQVPKGVKHIAVQTAQQMYEAVFAHLPADIAIMVAGVADFRVEEATLTKMKKSSYGKNEKKTITLLSNPDILYDLAHCQERPKIVVGFAAETDNVIDNATHKRQAKNCDIIIANKISSTHQVFGADDNEIYLISEKDCVHYQSTTKHQIAHYIMKAIQKKWYDNEETKTMG